MPLLRPRIDVSRLRPDGTLNVADDTEASPQRPAIAQLRANLPFLNGYLIHIRDEGWVWYFSSLAKESKPRVRARDGAVWPYSRKPL